jgi:hypothetical protein
MTKKGGVESAAVPANGKQGPSALTNNKKEIVDQKQADNVIKRSDVRINQKKIFSQRRDIGKNLKTCRYGKT